jgi:dihydroxy-acid dehydratase
VAPEAAVAGPIALVQDGDVIRLDMTARTLDLDVDAAELERRRAAWKPLPPRFDYGVLGKYARLVGSAAHGAVCG